MAVFIPVEDETVLEKLSGDVTLNTVHVHVVAIGWACWSSDLAPAQTELKTDGVPFESGFVRIASPVTTIKKA
ncbi:MAG: hypothetical protein GY801_03930 [bacterium]|nr:hypothetical protein [bacterium]